MLLFLYALLIIVMIIAVPFVFRFSVSLGQRLGNLAVDYRENKESEKYSHLKNKKKK